MPRGTALLHRFLEKEDPMRCSSIYSIRTVACYLLTGCADSPAASTSPSISSIVVLAMESPVPKGSTTQLIASGTYSDGSKLDLSSVVSWSSSDEAVASVSSAPGERGLVTALGKGTVSISASFGGKSGAAVLSVA